MQHLAPVLFTLFVVGFGWTGAVSAIQVIQPERYAERKAAGLALISLAFLIAAGVVVSRL